MRTFILCLLLVSAFADDESTAAAGIVEVQEVTDVGVAATESDAPDSVPTTIAQETITEAATDGQQPEQPQQDSTTETPATASSPPPPPPPPPAMTTTEPPKPTQQPQQKQEVPDFIKKFLEDFFKNLGKRGKRSADAAGPGGAFDFKSFASPPTGLFSKFFKMPGAGGAGASSVPGAPAATFGAGPAAVAPDTSAKAVYAPPPKFLSGIPFVPVGGQ